MTPDPHPPLLVNRYQLQELVGKGAMGRVYQAEDTRLGNIVAVKFLAQTLLNRKMRDRFITEAQICAQLGAKSINIIRVIDYGVDDDDVPFYVMEFLRGDSLSDLIKTNSLPIERFVPFARQICAGLDTAHKGIIVDRKVCPIVHRDIKPSNILIIQDPSLGELVKILDFGIAKLIQADGSQTQTFMGTLAYCSPEQMEGKELDNRSDIYSLGIMMYEMLTGEMPIIPENPSFGSWYQAHHNLQPSPFPRRLNIPKAIQNLILHCLEKRPSDRPQNVAELMKTLDNLTYEIPKNDHKNNEQALLEEAETLIAPIPLQPPQPPLSVQLVPTSNSSIIKPPNIQLPEVQQPEIKVESPLGLSPEANSEIDRLCLQALWPKDKPQAKIVFPRIIQTPDTTINSLWVMLNYADILTRQHNTRYNQFLFLPSPHPMLLWITVLYSPENGPRWLPCYLDMKQIRYQRVVRGLAETGHYRILFFAQNEPQPQTCKSLMLSTIAPRQCAKLLEWANMSQTAQGGQPEISKNALKTEFEKLKVKILGKLQAVNPAQTHDLSG